MADSLNSMAGSLIRKQEEAWKQFASEIGGELVPRGFGGSWWFSHSAASSAYPSSYALQSFLTYSKVWPAWLLFCSLT